MPNGGGGRAADLSLCYVTGLGRPGGSAMALVEEAVRGGVTIVQLRDKEATADELLRFARPLLGFLGARGVPLVINDHLEVAKKLGTGVHLGQSDLPWEQARRLLGPGAIIGLTVESPGQACEAENADVDYLGVSSVFLSPTKKDIIHVWGLGGLRSLRKVSGKRLVGIGGISEENADAVMAAGADGIAVSSAIGGAKSAERSAAKLRSIVDAHRRRRGADS